jgi:peroxiredoxin
LEGQEGRPLLRPWCFHRAFLDDIRIIELIKSHQPTCHINHLPPYLAKYNEFKEKGVDVIAVIAANDPFVMSGWGRVEGLADKASQRNYQVTLGANQIICVRR